MSGMDVAEQVLRLERVIPASCESLFALWIEPKQIARWWAPDGYEAVVHDLEVRPGGQWRIVLRGSGGREAAMGGFFRVVEPPRRLAFSWEWEEAHGAHGGKTEVTVTFEPVPGGTRLILAQQSFDSKDARDRHLAGWSAGIDRLMNLRKEEHP
jgi:uncharacterized protein YndB with AHSA1/START domain